MNNVIEAVAGHCKRHNSKLSQAELGYIERNTRHAILSIIRHLGPIETEGDISAVGTEEALIVIFTRDLSQALARSAIAALSSYISSANGRSNMACLVRTYAALALRNIDPIGRRWQASVLARTTLVLDTDVVLCLIVDDLPEHKAILSAVKAMNRRGMKLVIPTTVFVEAIDSLSRGANATHHRLAMVISGFSEEMAEGRIWNPVVRGYYYSVKRGNRQQWKSYHTKYWDEAQPEEYALHILHQRLPVEIQPMDEVPLALTPQIESAVSELLSAEMTRPKAQFRTADEMRLRIYRDVKVLFHIASDVSDHNKPRAYFVSADLTAVQLRTIEKLA